MTASRRQLFATLFMGGTALALVAGCTTTKETRTTIDERANVALDSLYRQVPAAKGVAERSRAILVFPGITQAGLGVGGQYGQGVLYENGKVAGYYNLAGGSFGLQIGAQTFNEAYFFTTDQALRTFNETKGLEVGAGVDLAVADVGASGEISTATLQKPVIVFVWGQQGLMAGVTVQGQKISRLESK